MCTSKGVPSVQRVVIQPDDEIEDGKTLMLAVEGTGFQSVIATPGIQGDKVTSNNIKEVERVLGIEAARNTIIREIDRTMEGHGLEVDKRHCQLLADAMCFQGQVHGITRFGIYKKQKITVTNEWHHLETPMDYLYDAAMT
eukprot:TRINITY_DN10339_c0_g1_i1.p1 TRINITY_DN10339_c0_g1~~TRINITY_DN10339_c0_g1_i1.p1  ORF type:complete len:141 (+),score=28.30 TRINITY_DN10339_c0_g1_i1:97-519(+)